MFKYSDKPLSLMEIYNSGITLYKCSFSKIWYLILLNAVILNLLMVLKNHIIPIVKATASASPTATSSTTVPT